MTLARIVVPAEMTGRELARRPVALGLLTALPLAFYEASAHHSSHAAITGGLAMAFSIAGASIFAALTARPVDPRLALAGYRPFELLLGRVLLLELLGLIVAGAFSMVILLGTGPADGLALVAGVVLVAVTSVPFGVAIGALAPHELEGVLVLIGVVGIQLTLESTQTIAKLLPFWGAQLAAPARDRPDHLDRCCDPDRAALHHGAAHRSRLRDASSGPSHPTDTGHPGGED